MPDTPPPSETTASTQDVSVETVNGLWALMDIDSARQTSCTISLQKMAEGGHHGVHVEGCKGTLLESISGWRIEDGHVALIDASDQAVIRFRKTGENSMEGQRGGATYRLETAVLY